MYARTYVFMHVYMYTGRKAGRQEEWFGFAITISEVNILIFCIKESGGRRVSRAGTEPTPSDYMSDALPIRATVLSVTYIFSTAVSDA